VFGDSNGFPGPGTFTVVNADQRTPQKGQAEADFNALDSSCNTTVAQTATGGTITVSDVLLDVTNPPNSHASGSFDLTFPGGHVTGTLCSTLCEDAAPSGAANAGPTTACIP
jgi:hypothetical protein